MRSEIDIFLQDMTLARLSRDSNILIITSRHHHFDIYSRHAVNTGSMPRQFSRRLTVSHATGRALPRHVNTFCRGAGNGIAHAGIIIHSPGRHWASERRAMMRGQMSPHEHLSFSSIKRTATSSSGISQYANGNILDTPQ